MQRSSKCGCDADGPVSGLWRWAGWCCGGGARCLRARAASFGAAVAAARPLLAALQAGAWGAGCAAQHRRRWVCCALRGALRAERLQSGADVWARRAERSGAERSAPRPWILALRGRGGCSAAMCFLCWLGREGRAGWLTGRGARSGAKRSAPLDFRCSEATHAARHGTGLLRRSCLCFLQ